MDWVVTLLVAFIINRIRIIESSCTKEFDNSKYDAMNGYYPPMLSSGELMQSHGAASVI